ncbi:hypothetical protein [Deinococcus sp. QL22]|uniref:hypothetical protein n=1 Tax=Deinococcus sp. QL22 TaxID=2939437 RepID=UPI0020170CA6|nr:hypothetical protein [Deinococcus sp. QL22]UQN10124.1 hypothetical protein M1R55_28465 [Deinococcus sp. QL22]UQN10140.1 hypothetical protein M1R55_28550 [Deinococcus sp. QL22]
MKTGEWAVWVNHLPAEPSELQQVVAQLQRQVGQAEDRLANVLIMGGNSQAHRYTRIEIAELNSKLLWLQRQVPRA